MSSKAFSLLPENGGQSRADSSAFGLIAAVPCKRSAARAQHLSHSELSRHAQSIAALERSGLKFQGQFVSALPRCMKFCMRRSARDFGIFLTILVARRIAEIVGMKLRHHVHRRCGHVFSN